MKNFMKTHFPVFTYWVGKKLCYLRTLFYRNNPIKWTKKAFKKKYRYDLNLNNPKLFCEKMNYSKHFMFIDKKTMMADKLKSKDYISNQGYSDLTIKVLFKTKNIKELKEWFLNNKNQNFVIKTNHSNSNIFIYKNGKIYRKHGELIKKESQMFKMLRISFKHNHYYTCFEREYKDIEPYYFVEEFIDMSKSIEYEIFSNYGEVKFIKIVQDRKNESKPDILVDKNFNVLTYNEGYERPENFEIIEKFITTTCSDIPLVRVDFVFGENLLKHLEFTFQRVGGIYLFKNNEFDTKLGDMFKL